MQNRAISPMITTLILVILVFVTVGITFFWSQHYAQEKTGEMTEDVSRYVTTTRESFGLRINSANSYGKIDIENIGVRNVNIIGFYIDGNFIDVNDFELQPGTRYIFNVGAIPAGERIIRIEGENEVRKQEIIEVSEVFQTASFSDNLDDNSNISDYNSIDLSSSKALLTGLGGWVTASGDTGNTDVNVSNNSNVSTYPSLALDSLNRPHIAWQDVPVSLADIFYREWNGSNWVTASGSTGNVDLNVSNTSTTSWYPSLALDVNGNPHMAWQEGVSGDYKINYSYWTGSSWAPRVVISSWNYATYPSLALDLSNNTTHIAWHELTGTYAVYYRKDLEGSIPKISGANRAMYPSLFLDSSNNPHIAWQEYAPSTTVYDIYYRYWNGSAWSAAVNVSNTASQSYSPSLFLDSLNRPHIAWHDNTSGNYETYYRYWNGSNWVTASGSTGSIDLNVSNNSGTSQYPSLFLDSNNKPHIAWQDYTSGNDEIYYSYWTGSAWSAAVNVSNTASSSYDPSLALDSNTDAPYIAWQDYTTNKEIFLRHWDFSYPSLGAIVSNEIDATANNIIRATLNADYSTPAGTSISWYLSNDNGATWETVTLGVEHTFASAGSQLRWRAELSTSDSSKTPEILNISISYTY